MPLRPLTQNDVLLMSHASQLPDTQGVNDAVSSLFRAMPLKPCGIVVCGQHSDCESFNIDACR